MKTQAAIDYFGGKAALAKALGVTVPALYQTQWQDEPPYLRQVQIELLTKGALKARLKVLPKASPHPKKAKPDNGKRRRAGDKQGA